MPYIDCDKSLSDQSTACLPYHYILHEHPSSANPPSSYIHLDPVLLGQVSSLHMVFKQVIGHWLSLVNSPNFRTSSLKRTRQTAWNDDTRLSYKVWARFHQKLTKRFVQLHPSFSSMQKPLTVQLVSSFQASSIRVGTCFLMTALIHPAMLHPCFILPSHKLVQKPLASLMSLNISPFTLFFLVSACLPRTTILLISSLSLSYACIQANSINLELLINHARLLLLFHSNKALVKLRK